MNTTLKADQVRNQYEKYPYPDLYESKNIDFNTFTLVGSELNFINQSFYEGKNDFENYRILVAGCGTGCPVLYYAQQLKGKKAEIVAIDVSETSLNITRELVKHFNYENVTIRNFSIYDLNTDEFGKFDHINCVGVLHHLDKSELGLEKLADLLKENGVMTIMLYGLYGRTYINKYKEILRYFDRNINDLEKRIEIFAKLDEELSNFKPNFLYSRKIREIDQFIKSGYKNGLVDCMFHCLEKDFTYKSFEKMARDVGLNGMFLCETSDKYSMFYDEDILDFIDPTYSMDKSDINAIREIIHFPIKLPYYLTFNSIKNEATVTNVDNVPFVMRKNPAQAWASLMKIFNNKKIGEEVTFNLNSHTQINMIYHPIILSFVHLINGARTIGDIILKAQKESDRESYNLSPKELSRIFEDFLNILKTKQFICLRHKSVPQTNT